MNEIKLLIKDHSHINEFILFLVENGYKVWRTISERKYAEEQKYYVHFEIETK